MNISDAIATPVVNTSVDFIWAISLGQLISISFSLFALAAFFINISISLKWIKKNMIAQHQTLVNHAESIKKLDNDLSWVAKMMITRDASILRDKD